MINKKFRKILVIMAIGLFIGLSLISNLEAEPLNTLKNSTSQIAKFKDNKASFLSENSNKEIKYGLICGFYTNLSFTDGWYYFEANLVYIRPIREIGLIYGDHKLVRVREDGIGRFGLLLMFGLSYFEIL